MSWYTVFWAGWVLSALLVEGVALWQGDGTPTGHVNAVLHRHPGFALVLGAFLAWLLWHWLWDRDGLPGKVDALFVALGALFAGLVFRRRP